MQELLVVGSHNSMLINKENRALLKKISLEIQPDKIDFFLSSGRNPITNLERSNKALVKWRFSQEKTKKNSLPEEVTPYTITSMKDAQNLSRRSTNFSQWFFLVALLVVSWVNVTHSMIYDNRFFPFIKPPYISVKDNYSYADIDCFITTARSAWGENDENIGIPELFGFFDEHQLAAAIEKTGKPNPLIEAFPTDIDILLMELPWKMNGKIQAQGMSFGMRKTIWKDWLSIGFSWLFMRVDSGQTFASLINEQAIHSQTTIDQLDALRKSMEHEIGITCAHSSQVGMGDLDAYLRIGNIWDYVLKCRRIQAGLSVGALVATGEPKIINEPASVPFGGNGHSGFYASIDAEFELKEDFKVGLLLRGSKRLARTCIHRMPACKEPSIFGAVVGRARVNPGPTAVFAPYAMFENLRDGFGALVQFTLTNHFSDHWHDERPDKSTVPANTEILEKLSDWRSSYVTMYGFYDFGKMKVKRNFDPIFTVQWDIPVTVCDAHASVKTQKITLGFEFNF